MKLQKTFLLLRGALFLFLFTFFGQSTASPQDLGDVPTRAELGKGVIADAVKKDSDAERAGLQVGDILLSWTRDGSKGEIESPFDLPLIEVEQAPRGAVTIEGLRGTEKRVWVLGSGSWGLHVQPSLPESLSVKGQKLVAAGNIQDAAQYWRSAAQAMQDSQPAWLAPWFLYHAGELLADARQWKEADAAYEDAVEKSERVGPAIKLQLLRAWAARFEQRADWANAERRYQEAAGESKKAGSESLTLADTFDGLGNAVFRRGDLVTAQRYYSQALEIQKRLAPNSLNLAKTLNGLGSSVQSHGDLTKAKEYYDESMAIRGKLSPNSLDVAASLHSLGNLALSRGDLAKAEEYHQQALLLREKLAPGSLEVAHTLNNLGVVAWKRGDSSKAEEYFQQALLLREKLSPDSLEVAGTLSNLGLVAWKRGDLARAEEYHQQALVLREKLAPDSVDVANTLTSLGLVAWKRGDLAKAEEYHQRALLILEKLVPDSLEVANALNNLGVVARDRGDLDKAEKYHRGALTIRQKLAPGSLDVATSLNNLGVIARHRGDLDRAEEYFRGALAVRQKLAPGSLDVSSTLNNLALVARDRGDLNHAEEYCHEALTIREKLASGSLDVAESLNMLGNVAHDRGDLEKATEYQLQALAMRKKMAARSVDVAQSLNTLGNTARDRRDMAKAEQYYAQALSIWENLAPERTEYAEALAALAGIKVQENELDTATKLFERALNVLEGQMSQFGGEEETRTGFRASHLSYYHDYIDLLMRQKQPEKALEVLERSRAQSLLEMLVAAHVDVRKGVDPVLLERERSLAAEITAKTNRRIRFMSEERTQEQVAAVNQEIEKLLAEHKDVEGQIRESSPGYAALTQPQPLKAKEVQEQLLDADTLLLEYSLGEERSYVWVITPESLAAYEIPKQKDIQDAAEKVYQLLTAQNRIIDQETGPQRRIRLAEAEREYPRAAAALSRLVLRPVAAQLNGKRRLLIVSDGALQYVPFAALPEPSDSKMGGSPKRSPLIVEHEIVNLPSASVLAVLRRERMGRTEAAKAVAVLADPVFDGKDARLRQSGPRGQREREGAIRGSEEGKGDASAFELTRSATDLGLSTNGRIVFSRLPWTRREAEDILAVTPAGQGRKLLDFAANHAAATDPALAQYRIVHFATHGLLDDKNPELSGLVLSLVNERGRPSDGFLGLREIYNLNLPVELVVLSGCQTGLGKELQGEGLIGLTRGFMYAGASRVVASLWNVSDVATAELMAHFYRGMEERGMPPAAALRSAQIKMWKQRIWRSPYFWAAFQIQGEWK